jgi:hypothetical protein
MFGQRFDFLAPVFSLEQGTKAHLGTVLSGKKEISIVSAPFNRHSVPSTCDCDVCPAS